MRRSGSLVAGITRNVIILGLVSLFTDLSSQMVFPLIPLFLTSVLGAGAYAVGIVEGAAETTASLLKLVSGYWSDRVGKRKPFVLLGYSLSSVMKPLFAFAGAWPFVLAVRVVERIGKGIRTAPRDAIVAESCGERVRGKAYGFHRAMDGIGSVAGAVLAFALLPRLGYRNVFLFAFVPGIVAAAVVLLVSEGRGSRRGGTADQASLRDTGDMPLRNVAEGPQRPGSGSLPAPGSRGPSRFRFGELPAGLRLYIIVSFVFALGHFGYAFLMLRAKYAGLSDRGAILLYVLFYAVYTAGAVPFGMASDRIGRKPVIAGGYGLFAVTSLGLLLSPNIHGIAAMFVVYGAAYAMIDGVQRAFVADLAPAHLRATALGAFHTAAGLAALPGGYAAGLLWDRIAPEATFVYGLFLSGVSLVMLTRIRSAASTEGYR